MVRGGREACKGGVFVGEEREQCCLRTGYGCARPAMGGINDNDVRRGTEAFSKKARHLLWCIQTNLRETTLPEEFGKARILLDEGRRGEEERLGRSRVAGKPCEKEPFLNREQFHNGGDEFLRVRNRPYFTFSRGPAKQPCENTVTSETDADACSSGHVAPPTSS